MQKRDVKIPDNSPRFLLLEKHRDYLEHYGETVDAYVRDGKHQYILVWLID